MEVEKAGRRKGRRRTERSWQAEGIERQRRGHGGELSAANRRIGAVDRTAADGDRFFRQSLASSRGDTPGEERRWRGGIYKAISEQMQMQGSELTIREMCEAARVSRASYY